jgi:hypothetical protein
MGEQAKHTPTPWTASEMTMSRRDWLTLNPHDGYAIQTVCRNSNVVAAVWAEDGVEEKDNAAFIVRACNAHDDLVATLTDARERMVGISPGMKALIARTDAALALAKSESRP